MPLASPTRVHVSTTDDGMQAQLTWPTATERPPTSVAALELAFITRLARIGTHSAVQPLRVVLPRTTASCDYAAFFGVVPQAGRLPSLTFSHLDTKTPFMTFDRRLWSAVEPELQRRLDALGPSGMSIGLH